MVPIASHQIIEGFDRINQILANYGKTFVHDSEQLEFNGAFVFYLNDGRVLMASSDGLIAILFDDKASFQKMLEAEDFPVQDPSSIFAAERRFVKTLNESIDEYIKRLNYLGVYSMPQPDKVEVQLRELSERINAVGKKKIDRSAYVAIGILLGEIIRRKIDGMWLLQKEMSLNPYYVPYVRNRDGLQPLHWKRLHEHWNRKRSVALDVLLKEILQFGLRSNLTG